MTNFFRKVFLVIALVMMILVGVATATPLPLCNNIAPSPALESVPVCATIPDLGGQIFLPAASWTASVSFEDINAHRGLCSSGLPGDCDYNEGMVSLVGNYITGQITMTYLSDGGAGQNDVYWAGNTSTGGLGQPGQTILIPINWVVGAEFVLMDHAYYPPIAANDWWSTGPASRNTDGFIHSIVDMSVGPSPPPNSVPEPATYSMMLVGAGLIGLRAIRFKRRRHISRE